MADPLLASLLMEHPFADDEGLLYTIDRSVTAGEARAAARALADELTGLGVGPGSAVAVALPNGPDVVITMTAVWLAGGVFVPVNPRYPAAEVTRVLDATEPAAVIGVDGVDAARDRARVRARRGLRDVDVGHHRRAESHSAHARGVSGAARPRAGAAPRRGWSCARSAAQAVTQPHSGVARSERRHLQRAVRNARRRRARDHGQLPAEGIRRARTPVRDPLDGAAARCDGDALRRRHRHRPHAASLRAEHHRAAVATPSAPVHQQVRRVRAEQLRPGGDRRGDRLDRRRRQGTPREGGRDRSARTAAST